jgi:hypothetical protein
MIVLHRLSVDNLKEEGEGEESEQMKGMLYTIYSFILHQQRLRQQAAIRPPSQGSASPPPPALVSGCPASPSPTHWDRLQHPVSQSEEL